MTGLAVPLDRARDHVLGEGPHELVIYGDYECPFSRNAVDAAAAVRRRLGDRLRLGWRHYTLLERHPNARSAAEAAEAAALQGLFWPMHDALFAAQDRLGDVAEVAAAVPGLDLGRWGADRASDAVRAHIEEDLASAAASGVTGTPRLFIAGRPHRGLYDAESLLEELLLA